MKSIFVTIRILLREHTIYRFKRGVKALLLRKVPPYNYVEEFTISNINKFLRVEREDILSWCIVGGKLGNEIPVILKNFPGVQVLVFECSSRYLGRLEDRFKDEPRVQVVPKAVSDVSGISTFFETNLEGSGSLLPLAELHMTMYNSSPAETFKIETVTLDDFLGEKTLDVLWVDIQGAEGKLLEGATKTLSRTRAIFIEVSERANLYAGSAPMSEINSVLNQNGFTLVGLGYDFNLTGNALYIRT
jgi:FkbM family methyltransferase